MGMPSATVDGKAGMNTRALIGAYQLANKLKVDCWPTEALLNHLRAAGMPGAEPGKRSDGTGGAVRRSSLGVQ